MKSSSKLNVNGTIVRVILHNGSDYVCITDIAALRNPIEPKDVVKNWMRSRATISFLGLWEKLHNPDFKGVDFDPLLATAGDNAFTMSPTRWIDEFNASGFVCKLGRGGGTFAHRDIAFEFTSWISAEFKLYLITEFERLKANEQELIGWSAKRELAKINYRIHTDAIQQNLIPATVTRSRMNINLRKRSRCSQCRAFRHDASAMAGHQPDAQRQPTRLRYHQPTHLHLQHGEYQRSDDQRRDSATPTPQESERNRHPTNAHPLRSRGEEISEMIF